MIVAGLGLAGLEAGRQGRRLAQARGVDREVGLRPGLLELRAGRLGFLDPVLRDQRLRQAEESPGVTGQAGQVLAVKLLRLLEPAVAQECGTERVADRDQPIRRLRIVQLVLRLGGGAQGRERSLCPAFEKGMLSG